MTKKELILNLTEQGRTVKEISEIVKSSKSTVRCVINSNGLKINRYRKISKDTKLEQFILGSMLGDGHITNIYRLHRESRFSIAHCVSQKEYIEWKFNLLSEYYLTPKKISHNIIKSSRPGTISTEEYRFKSLTHPIFTEYRYIFYPFGTKVVPKDLIQRLNPFGLAVWYMDDGNVTNDSFQFNTMGFLSEDVQTLLKVLQKNFGLKCTATLDKRSGGKKIYILKESSERFITIIKPFILPSMNYKLIPYNKRVLYKQGELLEHPEVDDQQPSLNSNVLEGSTTNSQIQTDNAEDSNANTSALPTIISPVVIQRDKDGNPLMSISVVLVDFSSRDDIV